MNDTTGDFSFGIQGFEITGGQLASPAGKMNVSGNLLELRQRLAMVGDDPYLYGSVRAYRAWEARELFDLINDAERELATPSDEGEPSRPSPRPGTS